MAANENIKVIPALLRKDVVATPIPFAETPTLSLGESTVPHAVPLTAPAVSTLPQDQRSAAEFSALLQEAARLKALHGLDFAVGNAVCEACGYYFGAIAPASETVFPCPKCRTHRARFKYNFVKEGRHWACLCGNVTFRITEQGPYCPQCGQDQHLPGLLP